MRDANLVSTALQLGLGFSAPRLINLGPPSASDFGRRFSPSSMRLTARLWEMIALPSFQSDNWIDGKSIESLVPIVFAAVSQQVSRICLVADALEESAWIQDISGPLNAQGLVEFLQIADILATVVLIPGQGDVLRWNWSASGVYSAKSAFLSPLCGSPDLSTLVADLALLDSAEMSNLDLARLRQPLLDDGPPGTPQSSLQCAVSFVRSGAGNHDPSSPGMRFHEVGPPRGFGQSRGALLPASPLGGPCRLALGRSP